MQRITGNIYGFNANTSLAWSDASLDGSFSRGDVTTTAKVDGIMGTGYNMNFDSANSPDARTGSKTEMESGTVLAYVFVGSYTA